MDIGPWTAPLLLLSQSRPPAFPARGALSPPAVRQNQSWMTRVAVKRLPL